MPRRRGRRSRDEQVEAVIPLIRADIWTLKEQKILADAIGVAESRLAARHHLAADS